MDVSQSEVVSLPSTHDKVIMLVGLVLGLNLLYHGGLITAAFVTYLVVLVVGVPEARNYLTHLGNKALAFVK